MAEAAPLSGFAQGLVGSLHAEQAQRLHIQVANGELTLVDLQAEDRLAGGLDHRAELPVDRAVVVLLRGFSGQEARLRHEARRLSSCSTRGRSTAPARLPRGARRAGRGRG